MCRLTIVFRLARRTGLGFLRRRPSAVGPSVPWIYRGTYQQGLVKQQTGLRALGRETTVPFGFHGWRYGSCSPTPFVSHPGYFIATMGGIICKDDM